MVCGAFARRAVAGETGARRNPVNLIHRLTIGGREGDVQVLGHRPSVTYERERPPRPAELHSPIPVAAVTQAGVTRDEPVEGRGRLEVAHADPQVIYPTASTRVAVVDGLGAVAVGVEQERAVVVGPVLRALARPAVVAIPVIDTRAPECIDALTGAGDEPDVQVPRWPSSIVSGQDREVVPLDQLLARVGRLDPDRAQHRAVEALRRCPVRGADRHVVEHGLTVASKARRARPRNSVRSRSCSTRSTSSTSPAGTWQWI